MIINNFSELKEAVKNELNIVEVMQGVVDIDRHGNGICPFHSDNRKGNFKVDFKTNRYKCFACGASGDALQYLQMDRGTDFITTVYEAGYELGLICEDEMKRKKVMPNVREYAKLNRTGIKRCKHTPKKTDVIKSTAIKKDLSDEDIELYDLVYRVFGKYCGLDEADMEHLICERLVGSDRLSDYFSLRNVSEKKAIEKTVALLNKKGVSKDDIVKVPGFALNKEGNVCLASYIRGLAMKARNAQGKVVGIQVRTEIKDKKYLWLSSSNKGGSGSSTPLAVEYPEMIVENGVLNLEKTLASTTNSILITEGKFKATSLCNNYNSVSLGLAGINNWRNKVRKDFMAITDKKDFDNLVIFADADCCYNPSIFLQFKEMVAIELYGFKKDIYVAYWNIENGKGVDDVINNGNDDCIKYMKFEEYCSLYNKYLIKTQHLNEDKITEHKEAKTSIYNEIFNL